ncbi:MAG: PrpF domain-containing protein [Candidatus Competibacteraceae bacterium]
MPGIGMADVSRLNAGNPTIFVCAADLGLTGAESQTHCNRDTALFTRCEAIPLKVLSSWD